MRLFDVPIGAIFQLGVFSYRVVVDYDPLAEALNELTDAR